MKKFRKSVLLVLIVLGFVFPTALIAKGQAEDGNASLLAGDEPVIVNFPTAWIGAHAFAPYLESELQRFEAQYGDSIQIKVEEMPDDVALEEKIKILIAANDFPDVCVTNSVNLVELADRAQLIVDFKPIVEADNEWKEALNSNIQDYWSNNTGRWSGISSHVDAYGYFYNKELFAKVGIDSVPATWDEFFKTCETLKNNGITPLAMGTNQNGWTVNLWYIARIGTANESGNRLANSKNVTNYMTPEAIQAAADLKRMISEYSTKNAVGLDYSGTMNNFYSGKAAMVANGIWVTADLADENKAPADLRAKVGVAMYPNDGLFTPPGYVTLASAKNDQKKIDAEVKVVKFFNDLEGQKVKLEMLNLIPQSSSIDVTNYDIDPLMKDLISYTQQAKYTFTGPWSIYTQSIKSNISPLLAALALKDSPEKFCQTLTDMVN